MTDWNGTGHSPGYPEWAWERVSESLRTVAERLPKERADNLVYNAFMSEGRRSLTRSFVLLECVQTGAVTLPDGEIGMRLEGKTFAIKKSKPWDEMAKDEREEWLKGATAFIMGDD